MKPERQALAKANFPKTFQKSGIAERKNETKAKKKNRIAKKREGVPEQQLINAGDAEHHENKRIENNERRKKTEERTDNPFGGPEQKKHALQSKVENLTLNRPPTAELPAKKQRFGQRIAVVKNHIAVSQTQNQDAAPFLKKCGP